MPPVILVFDPGGVTPPDDHHGEEVVSGGDEWGDVELGRKARVFAHADEFAVAPHSGDAFCSPEVKNDVARSPTARNLEFRPIQAGRVLCRREWWFLVIPRHHGVRVVREVRKSLACPRTRDIDGRPPVVARIWVVPSSRSSGGGVDECELPGAVE